MQCGADKNEWNVIGKLLKLLWYVLNLFSSTQYSINVMIKQLNEDISTITYYTQFVDLL